MKSQDTSNEQLVNELENLRRWVSELRESEARLREAEGLLKESEELHRLAVSNISVSVFISNDDPSMPHIQGVAR